MNNEIKINVPEGMEIDKENSTFECIKFKPKWIPKRGDIAVAGNNQIILVGEYIKDSFVGFNIKGLAVFNTYRNTFTIWSDNDCPLWVKREAFASEKELLINKLKENGYIYDLNDPRVIYKKEKELPKTWEEFCENNPIENKDCYINSFSQIRGSGRKGDMRENLYDANLLPSKEYAEAMLALCKLIQLRDCYNDGWEPDWKEESFKYVIKFYDERIYKDTPLRYRDLLAFKTAELRDLFIDNFKDLIEQAKLLL